MRLLSAMKRLARAMVLPVLFLSVTGYFVWHARHGERGTLAHERRLEQIRHARADLAAAEAERDALERRVAGLRGDRLDRDQLDERARSLLNLVAPNEIVVPYGPERRLY
ncbi:septum formation initiator family protein [Roseomonas sp. HF4]|uniref:FtsB family cell division protein n=1 Tax=Roseomonas sp. HF4 TaxID=2562313 RepID=UPI001F0FAECC|nr:septum formation initiator family protein [Roseomonas sp. HF4]